MKQKLQDYIDQAEKENIEKALIKNKYNKGKTAESLGINRKTLYNKIKKYSL